MGLLMVVKCDHTDVMDLEFRCRDFNFIHGIGHGHRDAGRGFPHCHTPTSNTGETVLCNTLRPAN